MSSKYFLAAAMATLVACTHNVKSESEEISADGGRAPASLGRARLITAAESGSGGRHDDAEVYTYSEAQKDNFSYNPETYYATTALRTVHLDACKANATLSRKAGTLSISIDDPKDCSNLVYTDLQTKKDVLVHFDGGVGQKSLELPEAIGANDFSVYLTSNSGKTTAQIKIHSYVAPPPRPVVNPYTYSEFTLSAYTFGRRWGQLSDCGGTVSMDVGDNGEVNLYFAAMSKCDKFVVLMDNGAPMPTNRAYFNYSFGGQGEGGKVTLNSSLVQAGYNSIKVVAQSQDGSSFDVVGLTFPAMRVTPPAYNTDY